MRANGKSQMAFRDYYQRLSIPDLHSSMQTASAEVERREIEIALGLGYTHKLKLVWMQIFHDYSYEVRVVAQPLEGNMSDCWHNRITLRDIDTMSNYEQVMQDSLFQVVGMGVMRAYQRLPIDEETFKNLMTVNGHNNQVIISWGQQDLARISQPTHLPEPQREQTLYFQSLVNKED